jgi:hypothetical protein
LATPKPSKLIEWSESKWLKAEPFDAIQFEEHLRQARAALADAQIVGQSEEGQFRHLYFACFQFSLAGLRAMGWRPNRQRQVVFEALPITLNLPEETTAILLQAHHARNLAEYEAGIVISEQLIQELFEAAALLDRKFMPRPNQVDA